MEQLGKTVRDGRPDALGATVTGHPTFEPGRHVLLKSEQLEQCDFSRAALGSFCSVSSRFVRCTFENAKIKDAHWGSGQAQSEYVECTFDRSRFRSVTPGNARFVRCSFREVRVLEFYAFSVELIDCVFSGRIDKGYLNATVDPGRGQSIGRRTNQITGNDFSECELHDFAFRSGVDLRDQKLPVGKHYLYLPNSSRAIPRARAALRSWPADENRRLAMILVDRIENDLKDGQQGQFFNVPTSGVYALPWERLRAVLEICDA